jgi:hypothetical protein
MKRTPQLLDQRSLELHRLIARRLREHPQRLERVRQTLARWKTIVDPRSQPYVVQWQRLVDTGMDAVLSVAVEDSERAAALRQCTPLGGVLTPRERWEFLKQWSADHAQT